MPQINQLPTRTPTAGDLVAFFSTNNGDAAKTSFTAIATLMTQLMGVSGGGGFITQYSQPTATAFTVVVGGIGQSTWLIVTPTAAGFSGTITFPDVSTVADQQELIISTTNDVLLTYVATSMTVFGAPAALAAGSSAVFKYNLVSKFWYCVSGGNTSQANSASCVLGGTPTSTTDGDPVAVVGESLYEVFTGSGITISEQDGYSYFSGLDATHAYALTYTGSVQADEAAIIEFSALDVDLNYIADVLASGGSVTATSKTSFTYAPVVTGATDVVLGVGRTDSSDPLVLDITQTNARIIDLGIAV